MNTNDTLTLIQASRRAGGNAQVYTDLHAEISKKTDKVSRVQVESFAGPILNAIDAFDGDQAKALTESALNELRGFAPEVFAEDATVPEGAEAEVTEDDLKGRIERLERGMAELREVARSRGLL